MTDKKPDSGTAAQLKQLSQTVKELVESMRQQQKLLQARGMSLPSNTMNELKTLRSRMDRATQEITGVEIELIQLRALADTTALITSTLDVDEVLRQVMDTVIRLTGAERGYIVLRNRETGEMEFRIARGMDQEQLDNNEFIVSRTIVNQVTETGEPVLTDNASADVRFQGQESIVGFALRSILAVPLKTRGSIVGVVYCDNRILAGLFRQHELNLLTAFGDQAAVAIENARLFADARAQLQEVTAIRDLMENIFSSVASGILTMSINGNVTTMNATAETILDQPKKQILGRQLPDVLPGYTDDFAKHLENVINDGTQERLDIEPVLESRGHRHWSLIMSPLRDAVAGMAQGVAMVLDDFTEMKEREAQLAQVRRYVPMANLESIRASDVAEIKVEVRPVTALFCDVRGFTSFSEKLEPEDLMRVINRYLSLASDAIDFYEGMVDKYMGDAVTGLFNTQLNPQEDHALRAVRAAMNMVYDLYALHEVLPEEQRLFYGTGIHTGPAVLGNVGGGGREEFSALGEAMDVCKILQENAGPGEIIISESTYELVQNVFECEPITPKKVKGRDDLQVAYLVKKLRKGSTGAMMLDPELMDLLSEED